MEYDKPNSRHHDSNPPPFTPSISDIMSTQQAHEGRRTLHIYQNGNYVSLAGARLTYRVTDNGKTNELYTAVIDPRSNPSVEIFSSMPLPHGDRTFIGSANVPIFTLFSYIPTLKVDVTVRNQHLVYAKANTAPWDIDSWSWTSPAFGGNMLTWTRTTYLSTLMSCFIGSRRDVPVATFERTMAISKRGKIHIHDPAIQYGSPAFDELVVSVFTHIELEKQRERARSSSASSHHIHSMHHHHHHHSSTSHHSSISHHSGMSHNG